MMETRRKLPIGIQSFEELRTGGYLYVDKTAYIYQLATEGKPYFLSRPRRFGKSLLLSTIKAYFQGKKELFEGLAIAELEKEWMEYPVFHLDMNTAGTSVDMDTFRNVLETNLQKLEQQWGKNTFESTPASRLVGLIERAHQQTGRKVVVLIDEYDKPLLDSLDNPLLHDSIHKDLGGFYAVLKTADPHLQFVLLTGITKFSQVNVFSKLNQLIDISIRAPYTGICGITEAELLANFQPELHALAENNHQTYDQAVAEMKKRYDGYHFARKSADIYNPFSVLNVLKSGEYDNYWFQTGTPTALIRQLETGRYSVPKIENGIYASADELYNYRIESDNLIPFLYQSGYLTIKSFEADINLYVLGIPNEEVKYGFYKELLAVYVPTYKESDFASGLFVRDLRNGDVDGFMNRLKALFASIPYSVSQERRDEYYYQSICFALFSLMGEVAQMEVQNAQGRADLVVTLPHTVYVFEFKMMGSGTAEEALAQINDKGYAIPYSAGGRRVVKVGAEFSEKERTVGRWMVEED
ncbi:MAG: ATP-binding protein [Prevotellaceae bacterium]|jgi:hypothetical protein|nr:ATP-binding protein [Prevotellaceae bacterium]